MAKFDSPQLRRGGLSDSVYVITHGKEIDLPNGKKGIEASVKYDVTDQFEALCAPPQEREAERG